MEAQLHFLWDFFDSLTLTSLTAFPNDQTALLLLA